MNDAQRFLAICAATASTLLAAVGALNHRVDPFQQYRLAAPGAAYFPRTLQRHINPGLAKNADYQFVISGSSMMENYDLAEVGRRCGLKAINLATSAISAHEQRAILEVALRHRKPRKVLMTLDFNSFAAPIDGSLPEITEPLPVHLYDDNPLNDYRYLLSGPVAMRSLAILAGRPERGANISTRFDAAWSWVHEAQFARERAVRGLDPADLNRNYRQGPRTFEHMRASFETNIVPLLEANPDTEFNLVYPPYSILVWADFVQRQQLDLTLAFKAWVFSRVGALPNVRVFDLQAERAITHDLDRYNDMYHFDPAVNLLLIDAACGGDPRYRVSANSRFDDELAQQARQADPAALIAAARPGR
ncbi:MAG TPA: hypothetical protein VFV17_01900 [Usitatibacteraceae bacterium]|nr:hypothetical protein [Usitatibacteraceae bacterium]